MALAVDRNNGLYAGGFFAQACGNPACDSGNSAVNRVALWDGGAWFPLNAGTGGSYVKALAVDGHNRLYAGGDFVYLCASLASCPNGAVVNHLAVWDPPVAKWSGVGYGVDDLVNALALDQSGHLYAGGFFRYACDSEDCASPTLRVNHVARWDSQDGWTGLGSGVDGAVWALALDPYNLLNVGGFFGWAGDKPSAYFAQYRAGSYAFLPLIRR